MLLLEFMKYELYITDSFGNQRKNLDFYTKKAVFQNLLVRGRAN